VQGLQAQDFALEKSRPAAGKREGADFEGIETIPFEESNYFFFGAQLLWGSGFEHDAPVIEQNSASAASTEIDCKNHAII